MQTKVDSEMRIPGLVAAFDGLSRRLLGAGVPMGPNALITVRGRRSGLARTTPVSLIEVGGRRWVQGTWGETNWVRNLRASGEATLTMGRRTVAVRAVELTPDQAAEFFRDVLGPFVSRIPFGRWLLGSVLRSRDILDDPAAAAARHPVFELRPG